MDFKNYDPLISAAANELLRVEKATEVFTREKQASELFAKEHQAALALSNISRNLNISDSSANNALRQWQEQIYSKTEILEPILKSLNAQNIDIQKQLDWFAKPHIENSKLLNMFNDINKSAYLFAEHNQAMLSSVIASKKILESSSAFVQMGAMMKAFESSSKHWELPKILTDSIGTFKVLEDHFGKVSLPIIDWMSANKLATLLGSEGIASQLAALGIQADGKIVNEVIKSQDQEKGIGLSRRTMELMALLSFLAAFIIPYYQDVESNKWQAKTDSELEIHRQLLENQKKQLQSLLKLVEVALEKEAIRTEDRYVVLERTVTVSTRPESGSSTLSKLLPREVVKPIDEQGKWIQIEYYDWFRQQYQTGWALKKYFKRVSMKHLKSKNNTLVDGDM